MDARRATLAAVALVTALAVSGIWSPSSAHVAERAGVDRESRLLAASSHGRTALANLGDDLAVAAARNTMSTTRLARLLATDTSAWLDPSGRLYYVEPALPSASTEGFASPTARRTSDATYPLNRTFLLHSKPGSDKKIYLDFNGQRVAGSIWNEYGSLPAGWYGAWTMDARPGTFNPAERAVIQGIWRRVAEDYAPFDVDVTTADPGPRALTRSSSADATFGTRALFTPSEKAHRALCGAACGGIAYVGTFDFESDTANYTQPAWIFPRGLGPNNEKFMAEAASHEVGHTLGLNHDGTSSTGYFGGHGSWAPIMGVGYGEPITQWSRGDYADANNQENDFAVMAANGLPERADEAGDSLETAADLLGTTTTGYIGDPDDQDVYAVDRSCSTPFSVVADPAATSPDLDIRLTVVDADGEVVARNDPGSGGSGDIATGLSARAAAPGGPGAFYVEVDGVGHGSPAATGYSDYGSLGSYTLTLSNACTVGPPSVPRGMSTSVDARAGTVTVHWRRPLSDGSAGVTGYRIRRDGERVASVGPGVRSFTFTGLGRGERLTIGVRAVNTLGDGPLASSRATVARPPGAPRALQATTPGISRYAAVHGRTVHLRWRAPAYDGGLRVTAYRVVKLRLSPRGSVIRRVLAARTPARSLSRDVLVPRTGRWTFRVRAINQVGTGWASPRSNVVRVR